MSLTAEGERQRAGVARLVKLTGQDCTLHPSGGGTAILRAIVNVQSTTLAYRYFDAATVRTWARPAYTLTVSGVYTGAAVGNRFDFIETGAATDYTVRGVFPVTLAGVVVETLLFVARPAPV